MPSTPSQTRDSVPNEYFSFTGALSSLAREDKARRGEVVGRVPLGYLPEFDGTKLIAVPDPERAELVRKAFALAARPNASLRRVLAEVTAAGLTAHSGKPLALSSLHHLLSNPFYAGLIRLEKTCYPARHEALVSRTLYRNVQRRLRMRRC